MSFQEKKRESIITYMLDKICNDDKQFIKKTSENYKISATSVKRYIAKCIKDDIIIEDNKKNCGYEMLKSNWNFKYNISEDLDEDKVFFEDIETYLQDVSKEALNIWGYVFMEMMNNAIEHSCGKYIIINIERNYLYTEITIEDDGVGIFNNIQNFLKDELGKTVDYNDVLTELYKGKLTTNRKSHTGEGIFFSSKMVREFAIISEDVIFSTGSCNKEKFAKSHLLSYFTKANGIGTKVVMKLENNTSKKPKEVFEMFAPVEEGFVKTIIPLKEVCPYGEPIARSQARRVVYRLEEFKVVEFDFAGIEFMGQGFADEVFRVFQNKYPEIQLLAINATESVLGMIKHVKR